MKLPIIFASVFFSVGAIANAEITPLSAPLQEGTETVIECELKQAPTLSEVPVFEIQKEVKDTPGIYHYGLWVPKDYNKNPQRRWPCVFIMSASGSAGFGVMKNRLEMNGGYIVVMLVEAKNGPWPPIIGDFLAAHDDVIQRMRVQEGLKFATGFSGGARASSVFAQLRPGFSGLIMQAAGPSFQSKSGNYNVAGLKRNPNLWVAMTMGDSDGNRNEIEKFRKQFGAERFKAFSFKGGHSGAPAPVFAEALDWIEHGIYVEGPAQADLEPAYLQYFNDHFATFKSAASSWGKYKVASELLEFGRNRNLTTNPQNTAQLQELQIAVQQLQNDPDVTRESTAADALTRLETDRSHTPDATFTSQCLDIAQRYPGTEAAGRAQALAAVQ